MPLSDLRDRVALVTGGSSGIGRELCRHLGAAGCRVAVGYRANRQAALESATDAGPAAIVVGADVRDAVQVAGMVAEVQQRLGPIDVLVSNAGRVDIRDLVSLDVNTWDDTYREHVRAAFLLAQATVPGMADRRWGRVLLMSSSAAFVGGFVGPHYASAKSALFGLAHWLSATYAPLGVTVNTIAPALIDTAVLGDEQNRARLLPRIPVGRFGTPAEAAEMMLAMLANPYLSGQTISLDGGGRGTP